jgi:glutamyl-tRNA synthetase
MQVLMKSDGLPTYHLANVVDDHLMEITHVIRGEEWVSSAPKHLLLYEYFGWQPPLLMHLPLLRNPDKSKLSKRKNPTSILFYRRMGYLPEAVLNFLAVLSNSPGVGEDEVMSLEQLIERFDLDHVALGGPVFDVSKLDWLNGRYIRERLSEREYVQRVAAWGFSPERLDRIAALTHSRIERLSDLGNLTAFLFAGRLNVPVEAFSGGKLDRDETRKAFQLAQWAFDALSAWSVAGIEAALKNVATSLDKKFRDVVRPFYIAITGSPTSIPLFDAMELLGRDIVRERLRNALEALGAPKSAEQNEWKKSMTLTEEPT